MKTLPTNKIDLASRWRPQPAVGGPSQPRRVAKFLFKIQCPSQPLAAPASCIRMLHSSCSKSSAPHLAFASARLMALRRLVAVLPTSSQYPPKLFPTSSLFLSISFLYDTYTYTYPRSRKNLPRQTRVVVVLRPEYDEPSPTPNVFGYCLHALVETLPWCRH